MKRVVLNGVIFVVLATFTLLNMSFTLNGKTMPSSKLEPSLLEMEGEEGACYDQVADWYWMEGCYYLINDCWQGSTLEFCWQELTIACPPPNYIYQEMKLKKCKEDDQ